MTDTTPALGSAAPLPTRPEPDSPPTRNLALGYLRASLVVLVLGHHSMLAYTDLPLPATTSLAAQPQLWRAFPIVDRHAQWGGFTVLSSFNDSFFMSLMFFISGLFVWSSLRRKGAAAFTRGRTLRLGLPFLAAAAIVAPIAYYPAYLQAGGHGLTEYARTWLAFGDWPTGPAWFIWVLLAFDLAAAALFAVMPGFGVAIGRLGADARAHPVRFLLLLAGISAAAYVPMVLIFGSMSWTSIGPFQFQTSRVLHYAVYFLAGIGVGAYGIDRGLLAPDGALVRHWGRWLAAGLGAFFLSAAFVIFVMTQRDAISPAGAAVVGGVLYAVTCGALSFSFLALFLRFANRRRWIYDSLSENEYGMYLVHYMFVSWVQLAILAMALPAIGKGLLVFVAVLLLSWATSAATRSIPGVARVV